MILNLLTYKDAALFGGALLLGVVIVIAGKYDIGHIRDADGKFRPALTDDRNALPGLFAIALALAAIGLIGYGMMGT